MKLSLYIPIGTTQEFAGYTDPVAAFDTIRERLAVYEQAGVDELILFQDGLNPDTLKLFAAEFIEQ